MKYRNVQTRMLVDFEPGKCPKPAFFILDDKRVRVNSILSQTPVRKTFDNCILYKCEVEDKIVELRWDKDKDRWFIEKIGE